MNSSIYLMHGLTIGRESMLMLTMLSPCILSWLPRLLGLAPCVGRDVRYLTCSRPNGQVCL